MSIRQLWVRIQVLLAEPDSWLRRVADGVAAEAAGRAEVAGIDDALAMIQGRED